MGIDASTKSIAFCVFWNKRPVKWGKIYLEGNTIYDKVADAAIKLAALEKELQVDYVAVEGAIMVRSVEVMKNLAYVYGAILGELQRQGSKVITVQPLTWQNYIGNKILTKEEKAEIKKNNPGRSLAWYQNYSRELRKKRTMDFCNNKWHMNISDDDVTDAIAISYFSYNVLTKRTS